MSGENLFSVSAGELYRLLLRALLITGRVVEPVESGTSPSAGKMTRELLGCQLELSDPRAIVIISEARVLNLGFAFGNFLNLLSSRSDVESLAYYNPLTEKFSDDGVNLHGAYGPRVNTQLQYLIALLRADPTTRRAVATIFGPQDHCESKDIPCPVFMQFFIRNGALTMVTYFRSQNIVMVYPYDIILFGLIHQFMAAQLGCGLGAHIQTCGSAHIYETETALTQKVLDGTIVTFTMPAMEPLSGGQLAMVLDQEQFLREFGLRRRDSMVIYNRLPKYWRWYLRILGKFAMVVRQGEPTLRDPFVLTETKDEFGL